MRLRDAVWIGILAVCVGGTVYEGPNVVRSLRYARNLLMDAEDQAEFVVPDRLIAQDREAGDILRYCIRNRYHSIEIRNLSELRTLAAKYPQNEFLLSKLAANLAEMRRANTSEALSLADKLLVLNPQNAHARYLRGWILLEAEDGHRRLDEALGEFEWGHRLPRFYLPYSRYKPRVDRLAERVVLDRFDRPREEPFYSNLGGAVESAAYDGNLNGESLRELVASVRRITDRVLPAAYDMESLCDVAEMVKDTEPVGLRKLDLSPDEARQARWRLSQALAIEDLRWHWDDHSRLLGASSVGTIAWVTLGAMVWALATYREKEDEAREDKGKSHTLVNANALGFSVLTALLAFITFHGYRPTGFWASMPIDLAWNGALSSWIIYPSALARLGGGDHSGSRSLDLRAVLAYALFWLNGAVFLSISNTDFLWSGRFTNWSQGTGMLLAWLTLCVLLRASLSHRQPVWRRVPYRFALLLVIYWAAILMVFDVFGAQWRCESRTYAEPLVVYGPPPAASQETYERVIVRSKPSSYHLEHDPDALPEYAEFLAPEDMKVFLVRRTAEGRPLREGQLRDLLKKSGRDVHPILREAIERLKAEPTPVQGPTGTS